MTHNIEHEDYQKLEEMMAHIECGRGYACAKSGFKNLGQVTDSFGSGERLVCLENASTSCGFQIPHGHVTVCNCPVRFYLHMHLNL